MTIAVAPLSARSDAAGPLAIEVATATDGSQWNDFLQQHPQGSYYHLFEWNDINAKALKNPSFNLIARDGARIRGVLPLTLVASPLFGRVLCSMPFVNYGGPVADDPSVTNALVRAACDRARELNADYLELRCPSAIDTDLPASTRKISLQIDLAPDPDTLWNAYTSKHRKNVKRAYQNNLQVISGNRELLDVFYSVMEQSWRALGTPFYAKSYFETIFDRLPEHTRIYVCSQGEQPVAVACVGYFNGIVEGLWAGGTAASRPLSANYVLYWEMIKDSCLRGHKRFHLGRSTAESGAEDFKKRWNSIADLNSGIALDVSPAADQLRAFNGNGKNLRIMMDTGVTTSDTQLSAAALNPTNAGVTAISYTNGFAGTATNTLYLIDTANDRLLTTPAGASGGVLANIGSLQIQGDVQAVAGLEINAVNNSAFAALQVGTNAGNSSDLYNINLTTGAATRVGTIGAMARVRKITYASPPVATLVGITTSNQLVSFNLATPGTFTSTLPVTGMQGGEMPAGLDIRPSNQTAYILSNGARVYTLNQTTGMAMLTGALTPANVAGNTFTQLLGANFGTDFSPPADALRIYTDAEQNVAVLVDSGGAIQATSLTRAAGDINAGTAPDIFGIAYTNNYANAPATVLYSLDAPTNSLVSTNPANGGVLNTVGRLTNTSNAASFTLTGDIDIVGGDNGLALAALQPLNATQSTLYRVNLQTGLLTPVGQIGPAGTQPLVGFTIRFQ